MLEDRVNSIIYALNIVQIKGKVFKSITHFSPQAPDFNHPVVLSPAESLVSPPVESLASLVSPLLEDSSDTLSDALSSASSCAEHSFIRRAPTMSRSKNLVAFIIVFGVLLYFCMCVISSVSFGNNLDNVTSM